MRFLGTVLLIAGLAAGPLTSASADDANTFILTIHDHKYDPDELTIPADTKVKLIVKNLDSTAEEFESFDLNREKVVSPGGQIEVFLHPLDPGRYEFFGDFHRDTALGHLVVK